MPIMPINATAVPVSAGTDPVEVVQDVIDRISKLSMGPRSRETSPHDSKIYQLPDGVPKSGTAGSRVKLISNYLHLDIQSESKKLNLHEYTVTFEPDLEGVQAQKLFLEQFQNVIGKNWIFKSPKPQKLFLDFKLAAANEKHVFMGRHPRMPELNYSLTLEYVERKKEQENQQITQFCDALFIKLYEILGMTELGSKLYDPGSLFYEPAKKLEIWPGLLTYTRYYDGGLMLGFDTTIRAMKTTNCYNMLELMHQSGGDMKKHFTKYSIGRLFMTKFNTKIYKIIDIDWEQTPMSTVVVCGKEMSYADLYKLSYGVATQFVEQPLLVVIGRCKNDEFPKGEAHFFYERIMPELCFPMRLEESKADRGTIPPFLFRCSKLPPVKNLKLIEAYADKIKQSGDCLSLLKRWNLELGDFVKADGRLLESPTLQFGNGICKQVSTPSTFAGSAFQAVPLENWLVFCSNTDYSRVEFLLSSYSRACTRMGLQVKPSKGIVKISPPTVPRFHGVIRETIAKNPDTQLVMVILPGGFYRQELYSSLKRLFMLELKGMPSQLIRGSTLVDKKRILEMMQRLAIQINCKLGGSPWALRLPDCKESIMYVGIDTYHTSNKACASVFAMICSLNQTCTKFYSRAVCQRAAQETGDQILPLFSEALAAYHDESGQWPDRVIVFRDGINNRNMDLVKHYELGQMRDAAHFLEPNPPKFTFIIVQKRIIERLYNLQDKDTIGNPPLGTVLDNTLTRINFVDFILVSELRPHCTARPVHYVVIANDGDLSIDSVQKLAHVSCSMYFNSTSSIRIPGICQYAHRLANLVGSHLKQEPIEAATYRKLYYL